MREAGYAWEIEWQKSRRFGHFDEPEFLREAAWVVLNSGFRESVIRKKFSYISLCFCDWESAKEITAHQKQCIATAFAAFRSERKLNAIARIAEIIDDIGFEPFRSQVWSDPIQTLRKLPFIGPITSWHLAKNLGVDVAKNDRHLERLAKHCGYFDAQALCDFLADRTGETRAVVDLILWRSATLKHGSLLPA